MLPREGKLLISRSEANGGDITYTKPADLIRDYKAGALHPGTCSRTTQSVVTGRAVSNCVGPAAMHHVLYLPPRRWPGRVELDRCRRQASGIGRLQAT